MGMVTECANCGCPFTKRNARQKHCWSRECQLDIKRKRNDRFAPKRKKTPTIELLLEAKNKPCMDCGGYWPDKPWRMEFDHREPSEKIQKLKGTRIKRTRSMRSLSRDELLIEIDKCDVVCRNCHADRTVAGIRSGKINTVPYKRARMRFRPLQTMTQGALFCAAR